MSICSYSPWYPLYTQDGNSLDPCFVFDIGRYLYIFFGVFISIDLVRALYSYDRIETDVSNGSSYPRVKYSFGSYFYSKGQKLRLVLVVAYFTLSSLLVAASDAPSVLLILQISVGLLSLALHTIEPTRCIVQSTSLLWLWFVLVVYNSVIFVQDSYSPVKVWRQGEGVILILSVAIFLLETWIWSPTRELVEYYQLNDWDINSFHNSFTNITFSWVQPLLTSVYQSDTIDVEKIPKSSPDLKVKPNLKKVEKEWEVNVSNARTKFGDEGIDENDVSLLTCILKAFWPLILLSFFLEASSTVLSFAQPFLQQQFILFFSRTIKEGSDGSPPPKIVGYFIASLFFIISMLRTILDTQAGQLKAKSIYSSNSIESLIYRKALKLSTQSRQQKTIGQIINHVSLDIPVVRAFPTGSAVKIVIAPFRVILCVFSLYKIIGNAVWGGVIAALVLIPLVSTIKQITTPLTKAIMEYKDTRLQLINEVVNSMLSVKLYTWEESMEKRIQDIRNGKELKTIRQLSIWNAFSKFVFNTVPFFILGSSFTLFVIIYSDIPLTPDVVFPALSLFNVLGKFISQTSGLITKFAKAKVSYNRIEEFLLLEEKKSEGFTRTYGYKSNENDNDAVRIANGTFLWNENNHDVIALEEINFNVPIGNLTCIIGKVGSGKSTLIKGILGELPMVRGSGMIHGSVAYCSQNAWIINASVKENITFGFPFERAFYDRTIRLCELMPDIEQFPEGDQTLVGEKGISLSGGQRARLSLARALYSRSEIYILDDILSAVDRYVGKKLIQNVLGKSGVIGNKTRIITTNYIPMIQFANEIILVDDGKIVERQKKNADLEVGGEIERLIRQYGGVADSAQQSIREDESDAYLSPEGESLEVLSKDGADDLEESTLMPAGDNVNTAVKDISATNEKSSTGKVEWSVFYAYFKACNYLSIFAYAGLTIASISITVSQTALLTQWSDLNFQAGKTQRPVYYLSLYAIMIVFKGAFTMLGLIIIWVFSFIKGSTHFHNKMISSVLYSPMNFFETTPVGTILNRFSNDVSAMDLTIPGIFVSAATLIVNSLASFIVIIWQLPLMLVVLSLLLIIYDSIRRYYIPASREFKRLSRTANSPLLSHLSVSISGLDTLNAYDQTGRYINLNDGKLENFININYTNSTLSRWLSVRLQTISSTILLSTCVFCLLSLERDEGKGPFDAAMVGFILNYALSIPSQLRSIITTWTSVETQTVAIERIVDYCDLPSEGERHKPNSIPENWPEKGAIEFSNYSTRYRDDLPLVLKGINLDIKTKEKIAIVGRTGSGKSTITRSIYRLMEGIDDGGYISIDGVQTKNVGLFELRHNLSIIPQNSQTIEGTVRQNLDPFDEHSDEELWKALELSYLKDHVAKLKAEKPQKKAKKKGKKENTPELSNEVVEDESQITSESVGLQAYIYEGGSNFSVGQKQLLCLARALLNPSSILILDEATAAVDMDTDAKLQETIRKVMKNKTILTIAHRLETIMDSDRVIVIEKGEIVEQGTPQELSQKGGFFTMLINHV